MQEAKEDQNDEEWKSSFSRVLYRLGAESFKTTGHKGDYLGCGSFGQVRRCYHEEYDTVVAKCYNFAGKNKDQNNALKNVSREANILSKLYHDNIVKVLGITSWGDNIAIIMEYVDGGSLQQLIFSDKIPEISLDICLCILRQLACGLDYLHNYKEDTVICHGDLKPSNVLFTNNLVVKLADLGSANVRNADGDRGGSILFESVQVQESSQYTLTHVAPEFLKNTKTRRQPSMDMYSLSMIIYEMLTGKPVYYGSNEIPLYANLLDGRLRPDLVVIEELEAHHVTDRDIFQLLKSTMIRCWDAAPDSRPLSCEVLRDSSARLKLYNGLQMHREWKRLSRILKGKLRAPVPDDASANLTHFQNQFIEVALSVTAASSEAVVAVSETPVSTVQRIPLRPQAMSARGRSPSPDRGSAMSRGHPYSQSFSEFTFTPATPTANDDQPEIYLKTLSELSENISKMAKRQGDEEALTGQCDYFLQQLRARLPTRNHFTLTMECVEIATVLTHRALFQLAVDFLRTSIRLYDVLKIGGSERQFWSARMSATCRNLADEMVKKFRDDDIRDSVMPLFIGVLDKMRSGGIDSTTWVSSSHNILKHVVHVCRAIHDHSYAKEAAEMCIEILKVAKSCSPTRTNLCSTGQLCECLGDVFVKLDDGRQAREIYREAIDHLRGARKWTNNAVSKEKYIAAVQKKLNELQIPDEVFQPVPGEVFV